MPVIIFKSHCINKAYTCSCPMTSQCCVTTLPSVTLFHTLPDVQSQNKSILTITILLEIFKDILTITLLLIISNSYLCCESLLS